MIHSPSLPPESERLLERHWKELPREAQEAHAQTRASLRACIGQRCWAELAAVPAEECAQRPRHLLTRADSSQEWSVRAFDAFLKDHAQSGRRSRVEPAVEMDLNAFRSVAGVLGLEFVGTWLETTGETHSFQCEASTLPYFPRDVPLRRRTTYWRWTRGSGAVDGSGG